MRVFTSFQVRFMKTGNIFPVAFSKQVHNLSFVSRILKTIYLLFREISRDDERGEIRFV